MQTIGIIWGLEKIPKGYSQEIVKTMYGNVLLFKKKKVILLPRQGKNASIPTHRINHKANMCALNLGGVEAIFGIHRVISLKEAFRPGNLILPDDYVNFLPETFFDVEHKSITPEISKQNRERIKKMAKKLKIVLKPKGIYVQIRGARKNTKAEISIVKKWGDVLGRSMASEATLSQELGIPYASLCAVEDYASGIGKKVAAKRLLKISQDNLKKCERLAKAFLT
ncbi:MTAP family purine nucleoside phosphorylase [Candidatus Woesearchaeota archaeon]|nr:MTAP family purine nucleoside phosphorylase [Candidatus Woesearchaeota archaeon]